MTERVVAGARAIEVIAAIWSAVRCGEPLGGWQEIWPTKLPIKWLTLDILSVECTPGRSDVVFLNNQTAHLTYGRETDATEKIGPADINRIKQLLDEEVRRFVEALPEKWRDIWNASAAKMGLYH